MALMRGRPNLQRGMLVIMDLEERMPRDHPLRRIKEVADAALEVQTERGFWERPLRPTQRGGRCPRRRTARVRPVSGTLAIRLRDGFPGWDRLGVLQRPSGRGLGPDAGEIGDGGRQQELGLGLEAPSIARLTQAQLILHDQIQAVFLRSLELAREKGLLKGPALRLVLDTTPILGRGAVKDTYNLLADGIRQLLRTLARVQAQDVSRWAEAEGYGRYLEPSIKGSTEVDGSDPEARRAFLAAIVADAERLLGQALTSPQAADRAHPDRPRIMAAAELLCKLLLQDIERRPDGVAVREGVSRDRIVSVSDPEMRHGRKSSHQRFDGHKASLAVEAGSQLITAVAVLPGNAPDAEGALDLVSESERNIGSSVCETVADAAYGDGETRRQFAEAERTLVAKVPKPPRSPYFTKQDFHIDLEAGSCTCPAGAVTTCLHSQGRDRDGYGQRVPRRAFVFDSAVCDGCPLRPQCVKAAPGRGRSVSLHPQEGLLQEARALQASPAHAPYRAWRQVVEHRLARLMQLGLRQARYRGRRKTEAQLLLTATVANLTRIWAQAPA